MKLIVYRISKFKQSDWLKKYTDFNTNKKKNASHSFEKYLFKLMNNSVYGKTMENLRRRIKFRLVNNAKGYKKYVSRPSFISQKTFNKNIVAIHETKPVLTLNKPISVGFRILDWRKLLMYEFYYKYNKSEHNANLLFSDTDSLVYEIEANDVNEH